MALDWTPFAEVPVFYPQGSHTLVAFLSELADRPVHEPFHVLFPVVGALSAGILYLIALVAFNDRRSGLVAAACYAFLPLWGSLDYFRWGGLPNALAMLLLCFAMLILMENVHAPPRQKQFAVLGAILCMVAIQTTHHYTLMVAAIFLGGGLVFTADAALRRLLLATAVLSLVFCAPLLLAPRLAAGLPPASSAFALFREAPLTLLDCVRSLNPVFVALFAFALVTARRSSWNALQLLTLSWFAGLLAAFVGLEYVYRGATLLLTRFQDCYTGLTPSRLATDLAYPMSILCGFIPLLPAYAARRRLALSLLAAAGLVTCLVAWNDQRRTGVRPDFEEAGRWLRDHTPATSMIVGTFPHLEYLSWRETAYPPLPASEPRNHPAVLWKEQMRTEDEWLQWQMTSQRPVYILCPPDAPEDARLREIFANASVRVMVGD